MTTAILRLWQLLARSTGLSTNENAAYTIKGALIWMNQSQTGLWAPHGLQCSDRWRLSMAHVNGESCSLNLSKSTSGEQTAHHARLARVIFVCNSRLNSSEIKKCALFAAETTCIDDGFIQNDEAVIVKTARRNQVTARLKPVKDGKTGCWLKAC